MKKILKILGIIVAILVLLIVAAVVALTLFFDPNDYRDDIARYVKDQTGRELKIDGDLSLSYFPWIGIEIGKVDLGNAPGFGPQPFAQVTKAGIKVQLLPLLHKELVMDKVILDGLQLNLARNEKGVSNWEDLSKPAPESKPSEPAPGGGGPGLARFDISGVDVSNSNLEWDDRQSGSHLAIRNLNLTTGHLGGGNPVPVSLKFDFLQDPKAPPRHFDLDAKVDLNLDQGTLAVNDLHGDFAGLIDLKAQVHGQGLNDKPQFTGHIELGEFVPRKVLKELDVQPPQTADETVLGKASLASDFKATTDSVSLTGLVAALDDTKLQGQFAVENFATAAMRFDLSVDEIDVDRYLPPADTSPAQDKTAPAPASKSSDAQATPQAEPDVLPVETLRGLNLNGTLKIGKLKAYNLRSEQIALKVTANKGDVRISPASAKLYGGTYSGDTHIDARGKQPVISVDEKLAGVQAQPLFKDAADSDLISGTANLSAKLNTTGAKMSQIKRGLNGDIAMAFENGSVKGINIPQMIRKASAAVQGQTAPADEPQQTDFTALTGTAKVQNGVVNNQDLNLKSPLLRVDGSGTADLVKEQLDYTVKAVIVASLQGQGGATLDKLKGVPIPVHIGGSFADPKFKVDVAQALTEEQKQRLEKKVDEQKDKLREKAQDQLKDKLPGLGDLFKRK